MKKEVFFAVLVGFALGLLITFGIWTANKSLKPKNTQPTPTPTISTSPMPTQTKSNLFLNITSPENEYLSSTAAVLISGKTLAKIPVVILSEKNQTIVLSDDSGNFSLNLDLEGGFNNIKISVTDSDGNSVSKDILVTYTTSKI